MADEITIVNRKSTWKSLQLYAAIGLSGLIIYAGARGMQKLFAWHEHTLISERIVEAAKEGNTNDATALLEDYKQSISEEQRLNTLQAVRKVGVRKGLDSLIEDYDYESAKQYVSSIDSALFSEEEFAKINSSVEEISPDNVLKNVIANKEGDKIESLLSLRERYPLNTKFLFNIDEEILKTYSDVISKKFKSNHIDLEEIRTLFNKFGDYLTNARQQTPDFVTPKIAFVDNAFSYLYSGRLPSSLKVNDNLTAYLPLGFLNGRKDSEYFFDVDVNQIPIKTKGRIVGIRYNVGNAEVEFENGVRQWMKFAELKKAGNSYEELGEFSNYVVNIYRHSNLPQLSDEEFIEHCFKKVSANGKKSIDFLEYLLRTPEDIRPEDFSQKIKSATKSLAYDFYANKQDFKTAYYLLSLAENTEYYTESIAEKGL